MRTFRVALDVVLVIAFGCLPGSAVQADDSGTSIIQRFDSIALQNMGELAQQVKVTISRVSRKGRISLVPAEQVSISLAAGGTYRWEKARFGRLYSVSVTKEATGEEIFTATHAAVRDFTDTILQLPGDPAALDPRDAQIAALYAANASLQQQNASLQQARQELQQRCNDLQATINDLEQKNNSLKDLIDALLD